MAGSPPVQSTECNRVPRQSCRLLREDRSICLLHITVQIQQSHSSSPQSHPKHGFDTVLIGFLIDPPELVDGRIQLIGDETKVTIVDWYLSLINSVETRTAGRESAMSASRKRIVGIGGRTSDKIVTVRRIITYKASGKQGAWGLDSDMDGERGKPHCLVAPVFMVKE
ncbi:uncharacterized protein N7482_001686 [Penicillium canariense]|uniref:Uncharacterized protein n=1 Tax=Penicillium canariense TaxID=189055 RepID=A0A9W9IDW4_9EURO|nr:uncharacterized protein N7482_001686 [Penicillium canariense]KAJ5175809.1 hypothetical protein N7482_001686 [Penicillium canariense]